MNKRKTGSILASLAVLLVIAMFVGLCMQLWAKDELKPSNWGKDTVEELPDDDKDGATSDSGLLAPDEHEANGISFKKMSIPIELYSDYGVSAAAETALQLTVTVTPANADTSDGKFTIDWKNSSSAYATSHTLSDKVTLNQTDSTHVTVTCLADFGEQIIVTYTVTGENGPITADYPLDYAKRVIDVQQVVAGIGVLHPGVAAAKYVQVDYTAPIVMPDLISSVTYSDYTVDDTFTLTRTVGITDTFRSAATQSSMFSNSNYILPVYNVKFSEFCPSLFNSCEKTAQFKTDVEANNAEGILKLHLSLAGTYSTYEADYYMGIDVSTLPVAAQDAQIGPNSGHTF